MVSTHLAQRKYNLVQNFHSSKTFILLFLSFLFMKVKKAATKATCLVLKIVFPPVLFITAVVGNFPSEKILMENWGFDCTEMFAELRLPASLLLEGC